MSSRSKQRERGRDTHTHRDRDRDRERQRQTKLQAKSTSWTSVAMVTVDNALVAQPQPATAQRRPSMVIWRVKMERLRDGRLEPATDYANERFY